MARRESGDGIREARLGGGVRQVAVLVRAVDDAVQCEDGITYLLDEEGMRIAAVAPAYVVEFAVQHGVLGGAVSDDQTALPARFRASGLRQAGRAGQ